MSKLTRRQKRKKICLVPLIRGMVVHHPLESKAATSSNSGAIAPLYCHTSDHPWAMAINIMGAFPEIRNIICAGLTPYRYEALNYGLQHHLTCVSSRFCKRVFSRWDKHQYIILAVLAKNGGIHISFGRPAHNRSTHLE
ncbi:hypothetical protein ACP4OV_014731 [Aristida adscensionis]